MKKFTRLLHVLLFIVIPLKLSSQSYTKQSKIHISAFPGFSNHKVDEIFNHYKLSLNLTSGVTGSVSGIELGLISNYNYEKFQGIQFAGLANISGVNNRLNPKEKLEETFNGFQIATISNKTFGDGAGVQISTFNAAESGFTGFQLGFLTNKSRYLEGAQIAGLINSSKIGMVGFQIAPLFNYSDGQTNGLQLGLFNYARTAGFGHEFSSFLSDTWQIGLITFSKVNNGNQIGLINISGKNNGVPLGLLNIDASKGRLSFRSTDLFLSNVSIATGSRFFGNMLQFGYNFSINGLPVWGMSYGLEKEWSNPEKTRFISISAALWQQKAKNIKLLKGPKILRSELIYGFELTKLRDLEIGIAANYQLTKMENQDPPLLNMGDFFPGIVLGIQ
ncbi:hypothetical protein MATR_13390 [Marivirga tractuosa]|uniref:Uncharacterized protein n=1 Tax=Marivirga tractuosa (strain ATCC 23168 / DSM 4126 / NBRC 15989 / NCIMB 1408 / VKM B-1430 / H-43) TaxID=643867 RepID=E4TUA3_MARTH|nr:hypothetical protein [Marivirga tractuosa]ADR21031.1 hypothetical protein Ftrac_1034 [Marivirga tractuosa DSM 4126]BDD14514.1 hypothetical protein MATR_13390 [Marivirga tractuosa]